MQQTGLGTLRQALLKRRQSLIRLAIIQQGGGADPPAVGGGVGRQQLKRLLGQAAQQGRFGFKAREVCAGRPGCPQTCNSALRGIAIAQPQVCLHQHRQGFAVGRFALQSSGQQHAGAVVVLRGDSLPGIGHLLDGIGAAGSKQQHRGQN